MIITKFHLIVIFLVTMAVCVFIALVTDTVLIRNNAAKMHGSVTSSDPVCSMYGKNIIKEGGSAVDAAITISLCIGVVNAQSSGIGGFISLNVVRGAFIVVRNSSGDVKVFDARETAPMIIKPDIFENRSQSKFGGLSVGVPGYLKGIYEIHQRYGKLPWIKLFHDAIKLSEKVGISRSMAHSMRKIKFEEFNRYDNIANIYGTYESKKCCFKKEKDVVEREKLSKTLSTIASDGIYPFYNGVFAKNIISTVLKHGGIMSLNDLKRYEVKVKDPIHVSVRGKDLYSVPPPSISSFVLVVLKVLDKFNLHSEDFKRAETYRKIIETFRHVYKGVENFGDNSPEVEIELNTVLSDQFVNEVYNKVKNEQVQKGFLAGNSSFTDDSIGTSHISVVDQTGQAVSITTSINRWFGSLLMTDDGIILNDQMDDFTFPSEILKVKNNYPSPGRRPRSGMSPIIIVDKDTGGILSIGGTNGTRIVTGVAYVLINIIFRGMNLKESIEDARIHVLSKPQIIYENNFNQNILKNLEKMGYTINLSHEPINIVNGARYDVDDSEAWGDSRKFGMGYVF